MRQPEIAGRTELAQGLAAAGFAVALAAIGGLRARAGTSGRPRET
jgi:hypothetical protein